MTRAAPLRPARELKSDAGDGERCPAELVDEIASELNYLSQTWTNPDAFLERRDFLVKRMRRLAKRLRASPMQPLARRPSPPPPPPPPPMFAHCDGISTRNILRLKGRT